RSLAFPTGERCAERCLACVPRNVFGALCPGTCVLRRRAGGPVLSLILRRFGALGSARRIQPEYRMSGKFGRDRVVGRVRAGGEIMAGHSDVIYVLSKDGYSFRRPSFPNRIHLRSASAAQLHLPSGASVVHPVRGAVASNQPPVTPTFD